MSGPPLFATSRRRKTRWPNTLILAYPVGVRAGITEIPPDAFDQIASGGEPDLTDCKRRSIDKAWYDYYLITGSADAPLKEAITGDCLHPQSPHTLDEFYNEDHEYYAGFVSPHRVKELARVLSGITSSKLKQVFADHDRDYHEYDWDMFEELQSAYTEAAAAGNALMILIA